MKLLLDTHVFIWWDSQSTSLSASMRAVCEDPENTLYLSMVSVWEMQIKAQIGKLDLDRPLPLLISDQLESNSVKILPIELPHIFALGTLPMHHRDPFDRLLISQAQSEGLVLVSDDAIISQYDVTVHS